MTPGQTALVILMDRYLAGLLDPFVTLLEVHKLMYFMQETGEPLRLRHVAGPYGPYAENLRHVLRAVEGDYVSGYGDGGNAPDKILQIVPGAVASARASLEAHPESRARCEKVVHPSRASSRRSVWNCSPPSIGSSRVIIRSPKKTSSLASTRGPNASGSSPRTRSASRGAC